MIQFRAIARLALLLAVMLFTSATQAAEPLVIAKPEMFSITVEIATAIISEAYRRTDTAIKIIEVPTARSIYAINAGTLDGEVIRNADIIQRTLNVIAVDEPILSVDFGVYTKAPALKVTDWQSLSAYRLGVMRGIDATSVPTEGMDRVFADSLIQLFELLERNRVDLILAPLIEGNLIKRQHPDQFLSIRYHPPPLRGILPFYHALNKKHQQLAERLARALKAMKADGTTARISTQVVERYFENRGE